MVSRSVGWARRADSVPSGPAGRRRREQRAAAPRRARPRRAGGGSARRRRRRAGARRAAPAARATGARRRRRSRARRRPRRRARRAARPATARRSRPRSTTAGRSRAPARARPALARRARRPPRRSLRDRLPSRCSRLRRSRRDRVPSRCSRLRARGAIACRPGARGCGSRRDRVPSVLAAALAALIACRPGARGRGRRLARARAAAAQGVQPVGERRARGRRRERGERRAGAVPRRGDAGRAELRAHAGEAREQAVVEQALAHGGGVARVEHVQRVERELHGDAGRHAEHARERRGEVAQRGDERREHHERPLAAHVLAGEPVRLDPRDRELAEHVGQRPRARAVGAPQDRGGGLVVDVERDALREPRGAVRLARGLGDVEVDDRGAQRGREPGGGHALDQRGEPVERRGRQAAAPGVLEPREVAPLEPAQLAAEQARRDVIEQRPIGAVVVLDLRRHRRRERRELGQRRDDRRARRAAGLAQRLEQRRGERGVREHRRGQRGRREPRRERGGADALDQALPRGAVLGRGPRERAQRRHGAASWSSASSSAAAVAGAITSWPCAPCTSHAGACSQRSRHSTGTIANAAPRGSRATR